MMGRIDPLQPTPKKQQPAVTRSAYPTLEEFTEYFKFFRTYNPHRDNLGSPLVVAHSPQTGANYEAHIGSDKLYEIENNLTRKRRNILSRPVVIQSLEHFAWVLFCKLKQRHDLYFRE